MRIYQFITALISVSEQNCCDLFFRFEAFYPVNDGSLYQSVFFEADKVSQIKLKLTEAELRRYVSVN